MGYNINDKQYIPFSSVDTNRQDDIVNQSNAVWQNDLDTEYHPLWLLTYKSTPYKYFKKIIKNSGYCELFNNLCGILKHKILMLCNLNIKYLFPYTD